METLNMEIKNTIPVLNSLSDIVKTGILSENVYLTRLNEDADPNHPSSGLRINSLGVTEAPLPEVLELLGIRSITLNASYDFTPLSKLAVTLPSARVEQYQRLTIGGVYNRSFYSDRRFIGSYLSYYRTVAMSY
jgi:hypothetical protein